jgi:hypothetical protein
MQQIQKPQINGVDFIGAVIAEDIVHRCDGVAMVAAVATITDFQPLLGMGIEKLQVPFTRVIRSGHGLEAWRQDQAGG